MTRAEYPLPAQKGNGASRKASGFATPQQDKLPQCARMLPMRVLPIIFLPGIMGSNLVMSLQRQEELGVQTNIAWRPDKLDALNVKQNAKYTARERQLQLDPMHTAVDIYAPSGLSTVSGDERNDNVRFEDTFRSPLLADDPLSARNPRTAVQKARARGWGEVYFKSYGRLLQHLETRLNFTFFEGRLRQQWRDVVGVDPSVWQSDPSMPLSPLTEDELKDVVRGCWFPVYAFGYNWLQSNGDSAKLLAKRINNAIDELTQLGYECNQVIVVTHSMGGLVGRALLHPKYGNMRDKILGIVHGVMPAVGAPAAYKRMRTGFEDPGLLHSVESSIGAKIAGNFGDEVTAVLANSPGGLQLLPSGSYGNNWLKIVHNGRELEAFPKNGDPFGEIYKLKGKWYSLFREEWINPSDLRPTRGGGTFQRTCDYLEIAQAFHRSIVDTYHPNGFAHYGADHQQRSFTEVVWEISKNCVDVSEWKTWPILADNRQGILELVRWDPLKYNKALEPYGEEIPRSVYATISQSTGPGDQTVPAKSADHQLKSGKFRGIFRQTGYEHQSSYMDERVIACTLYSIVRIAQRGVWKCQETQR